ncbi:MAG: bacillithiol biosynthesis cysteine-adding enzyme BshC [Chitinophagaceae bacterium]|uniref:bacillithiol biosynthesis cysteine-adding enzyme BshC n=1 Tax=unclassified Paraflavitalea TaxID=2798305 RepID=UPI003D347E9E|nr:bacillithiol biosynthesis cysteine-adding enzyme BshC [Chitinophagaceae bacterium]
MKTLERYIMKGKATLLRYQETGYFSKLITDYLSEMDSVKPFYRYAVNWSGIEQAMAARDQAISYRSLLHDHLITQYKDISVGKKTASNIELIQEENTYTVCTAHQPTLFTGTLYFVYKILHTVKLCAALKEKHPSKNFVPIFWMGSEDADLDELGKIYLGEEKLIWETKQTGAVGRMNPKGLQPLIERIAGELGVQPFGNELSNLLRSCYLNATDIQTGTFHFIHQLFDRFGLVVLIPDSGKLKTIMKEVFWEDLTTNRPSSIVEQTITSLQEHYKVQANPRKINLFYLDQQIRERFEKQGDRFVVVNTNLSFSESELRNLLEEQPEKFSPNVILRGLFQETLLPNIAFIGGGGETAYWLELKDLFQSYCVPFPVLVLRNSMMLVNPKQAALLNKLNLDVPTIFREVRAIIESEIISQSGARIDISTQEKSIMDAYESLQKQVALVDQTLVAHIASLKEKSLKPIQALKGKMMRAERRKQEDRIRQLETLKNSLFPKNGLQERIESILPYYASYGTSILDLIYENSQELEAFFTTVEISE